MKRRGVRFQPEVSVFDLPAAASAADDGGVASNLIWYQREDLLSFRQERLRTMKALQTAGGETSCLDPDKYCVRGLEDSFVVSTSSYARERRCQQTNIIRMVLEAQSEQRQMGVRDPESIKRLSMILSKVSRDRAVEIAKVDASNNTDDSSDDETSTKNNEQEECYNRMKRSITTENVQHSSKRHKSQHSTLRHSPSYYQEIRSTTPSPE